MVIIIIIELNQKHGCFRRMYGQRRGLLFLCCTRAHSYVNYGLFNLSHVKPFTFIMLDFVDHIIFFFHFMYKFRNTEQGYLNGVILKTSFIVIHFKYKLVKHLYKCAISVVHYVFV